jgi:Mitochondrial carrier protein
VQGRPLDGSSRLSAIDAGVHLLRSRGVSGLYRGAVPSVMRAFIVSGTRFSTYEVVIAALQKEPR